MSKSLILLIFIVFILYGTYLTISPVYLNQDELMFGLNAYSISKSLKDDSGIFLPLYFRHLDVMWATPVLNYLTAVILLVFPLSETSIRFSSVIIGVLDVVLIYLIAKKIFKSNFLAVISGFSLLLAPAHFIHSRLLLDNLTIVPFVLIWFYFLIVYLETKSLKYILFASLALGIGVHSYHAAKITMPLLFIPTIFIAARYQNKLKTMCFSVVAFLLPLAPLYFWLQVYPDTLVDQVKYTRLYDEKLGIASGILTVLEPSILLNKLEVYFRFFNPEFLFLKGDNSLIHSTHKSGVFLYPFLLLIPFGIIQIIKKINLTGLILIYGFITSSIAAAVAGSDYRISRALPMVVFGVLLGIYGMRYLHQKSKLLSVMFLIIVTLQFGYFYNDYLRKYPDRSFYMFNYNIPEAFEKTIEIATNDDIGTIFIDEKIYFSKYYWKFYSIKNDSENLNKKVVFVNINHEQVRDLNADLLARDSLLLFSFNQTDGLKDALEGFEKIHTVREPVGSSFYIYKFKKTGVN